MGNEISRDGFEPFGKFLLRKRLGKGGMAEVFLAEMRGIGDVGKLVALKKLHAHLAEDADFISSFIREARLGSCLNHPNIVQTLELGKEGNDYYMAMEFVDGMTLGALLRHRKHLGIQLPLSVTLEIVREISKGLAYAHEASDLRGNRMNMVHRDLKPENVLISHFGGVKLSDFGVARADSDWSRTLTARALKGTIGCMSPEQARCQELDHRSDLFSLGTLLFEMLTAQPLYPMVLGPRRLRSVQNGAFEGRLELLKPYPPLLVGLVQKLLAKNVEERPASASEVLNALNIVAATIPFSQLDIGEVIRSALQQERKPESGADVSLSGGQLLPIGALLSTSDSHASAWETLSPDATSESPVDPDEVSTIIQSRGRGQRREVQRAKEDSVSGQLTDIGNRTLTEDLSKSESGALGLEAFEPFFQVGEETTVRQEPAPLRPSVVSVLPESEKKVSTRNVPESRGSRPDVDDLQPGASPLHSPPQQVDSMRIQTFVLIAAVVFAFLAVIGVLRWVFELSAP